MPVTHVASLVLVAGLDEGAVDVTVARPARLDHAGPGSTSARVRVLAGGPEVGAAERRAGPNAPAIPLTDAHPWTPEDPYLYDVEVRLGEDRVHLVRRDALLRRRTRRRRCCRGCC